MRAPRRESGVELSKPSVSLWESRRCRGSAPPPRGADGGVAAVPSSLPLTSLPHVLSHPPSNCPVPWAPFPGAAQHHRPHKNHGAHSSGLDPLPSRPASAPPLHGCFWGGLSRKLFSCPCQGLLLGEPRLNASHSTHACPAHTARPCLFLSRQGQASPPRLHCLWPNNIWALSSSLHRSWALCTPRASARAGPAA